MDGVYPIKPSDINADHHFFDAFGNSESETSARWLVKLAQKNGDWRAFTKDEIDTFSGHRFRFNNLIRPETPTYSPIVKNDNGTYSFTHMFVANCFRSSPANDSVN
jgi:hypothetical protein